MITKTTPDEVPNNIKLFANMIASEVVHDFRQDSLVWRDHGMPSNEKQKRIHARIAASIEEALNMDLIAGWERELAALKGAVAASLPWAIYLLVKHG